MRHYCIDNGLYQENIDEADVILFNSFPGGSEYLFDTIFNLKKNHPDKILIHRIDGPIHHIRQRDQILDELIYQFNDIVIDGTIFQSDWSKLKNYGSGYKRSKYETTITNAPDSAIFNKTGKRPFNGHKVKLIATSWSPNVRKGFDIYEYIDNNLNFNRFEMTFVGNSPVKFKNIRHIPPVPSVELAGILKEHDIYITASRSDPCSNSLIEALHCGLPAIALNDGGHPEIVGRSGELFDNESNVLESINKVASNYSEYQSKINVPDFDIVGNLYYKFAEKIHSDYLNNNYSPKHINIYKIEKFKAQLFKRFATERIGCICKNLRNKNQS